MCAPNFLQSGAMNVLVISCSLNPGSNSHALAREAAAALQASGVGAALVDLREHEMPLCDGETCTNRSVADLTEAVRAADAILLAVPVYNFDANAAAKNLVEHTGSAWEKKIVGFLAAAGGHSSYMSIMSLANSLMLDFHCLIVPRFVYAVGQDFTGGSVSNPKVAARLTQLLAETIRITGALAATAPTPR